MTDEKVAEAIATRVLEFFSDRSGFDNWWDGIDVPLRREIKEELVEAIRESLIGEQP